MNSKLLEAAKAVLELHDKQGYMDTAIKSAIVMETLHQAVQEVETPKEYTDVEDFIAKTSKPFEPADLFVGGMDGYVHWAGWGISIKNDIPVTLTVRDEIYDVVPKGKHYTPMTDEEIDDIYLYEKYAYRVDRLHDVERAVIERLGLVWGD